MSVRNKIEPISEKKYINPSNDWKKIKESLREYCGVLDEFDECINEHLDITNSHIIVKIASALNMRAIIDYDYKTELTGTDRLVDICKHYHATTYLSGSSGSKYLDLSKFGKEKIKVEFQTGQQYTPIISIL